MGLFLGVLLGGVIPSQVPQGFASNDEKREDATYSSEDVSRHARSESCWTIIDGTVYDLSTWIRMHPGGDANILMLCGKDATARFTAQHGKNSRVKGVLSFFKIGSVVSSTSTEDTSEK